MDDTSGGEGGPDEPPTDEPTAGSSSSPWDESMLGIGGSTASDRPDEGGAEREDADDPDDGSMAGGNVAGEFTSAGPIEPGTPDLENALFVAAGALLAVLAVAGLILGPGGLTPRALAVVTGATALVAAVCFGFFGLLNPGT